MSGMIDTNVSECARVAAWSLRGLGMAFEIADRAAPLVGWAEAVEGGALRTIRQITPILDGRRPVKWRSRISDATWSFDASGRSVLELGPIAIDVLTMAARTGHIGRVDLHNVVDPIFLSGVVRLAARRGIGLIAISNGPLLSLCGAPTDTLHAYPGLRGPLFDTGSATGNAAVDDAVAAARAELAQTADGLTVALLSYTPADARIAGTDSPFDAERKLVLAQARGIPVAREDLDHLYQLEIRTYAPTSERSRGQALF